MPAATREWEIGSWCSPQSQIILITGRPLLGEKWAFYHSCLNQTGPQEIIQDKISGKQKEQKFHSAHVWIPHA